MTNVVRSATTLALLALAAQPAQPAENDKDRRPWQLELGVGASHEPNFRGAQASTPRLLVWASGEYESEGRGTLAFDMGSLTLNPSLR